MDQEVKLRKRDKIGAIIKPKVCAFVGITASFSISFIASDKGCKAPVKPTASGPSRCWIDAIIFLSANVKKATASKIGRIRIIRLIIFSSAKIIIKV